MNSLLGKIVDILADLPDLEIHDVQLEYQFNDRRWDAAVIAEVKGEFIRFLVDVKAYGYPRDMHQAILQAGAAAGMEAGPSAKLNVPIVAAPAISETSRELLRDHGMAYIDAGGSMYIDLPQAIYWVDRPTPPGNERSLRDPYHGSSAQVLHALLQAPDRPWHINELAEVAGVAQSTAHQVCRFLEEQLLMETSGRGPATVRYLREPGKLLDDWADSRSLTEYAIQRFHRWTRDPLEIVHEVADVFERWGVEYALTLSSGAELVAPYATSSSRIWILTSSTTPGWQDEIAREARLQPVEDGEMVNLLVTEERSPLLFRREVRGLWVASDIQLYLDLWAWPQRGREQARHLRAERIGF